MILDKLPSPLSPLFIAYSFIFSCCNAYTSVGILVKEQEKKKHKEGQNTIYWKISECSFKRNAQNQGFGINVIKFSKKAGMVITCLCSVSSALKWKLPVELWDEKVVWTQVWLPLLHEDHTGISKTSPHQTEGMGLKPTLCSQKLLWKAGHWAYHTAPNLVT